MSEFAHLFVLLLAVSLVLGGGAWLVLRWREARRRYDARTARRAVRQLLREQTEQRSGREALRMEPIDHRRS